MTTPAEAEQVEIPQASSLGTAMPLFRRPFTGRAVKWKIQTNPKEKQGGGMTSALVVTYMDSRLVAERLNAICPADWSTEFDAPVIGAKGIFVTCRLTVFGVTRMDVGFVPVAKPEEFGSQTVVKGVYSDAMKRAAVQFGIGAFLYALPKVFIPANALKHVGRSWYLTTDAETMLREQYAKWLALESTAHRFGAPLDHGDIADAQGDIEAGDADVTISDEDTAATDDVGEPSGEPETEPPTTPDPDAEAALDALRAAYADSAIGKAEWGAKLLELGIDDVEQATPEQIKTLAAFLAGSPKT
jgi:hypothetical protein